MPFINDRIEENRRQLDEQASSKAAVVYGSPVRASRFKFDPDAVMALLRERIIGQPDVLSEMDDLLHVVKADIGSDHRPLSVSLFLGPTGVGKTETVRMIAEGIYGSADKLCRIDMNTLSQEHYAAALTGAPPGYVGSKEGQTLFDIEAIQGSFSRPGMVLFDELEKASPEVIRSLLNVLDSGHLVLSSGAKTIDFRNCMIFMTSNIGAKTVADYRQMYQSGWRKWLGLRPDNEDAVLDQALHQSFDPEFINRIDRIIPFQRLNDDWLDALLDIELAKLQRQMAKKGVSVTLTPNLRSHFCEHHDERYGARDLARRLRLELQPNLARAILTFPNSSHFEADWMELHVILTPCES